MVNAVWCFYTGPFLLLGKINFVHLCIIKIKLKIMKKQFIVIALDNAEDFYVVDDLKELIREMYEEYNDKNENSFYNFHKVIEIKGEFEITEMN